MFGFDLLVFGVAAAIILVAGRRLVLAADAIALGTSLGHTRVGLLLLSVATSLPEVVSGVTATAFLRLPNIAVGNLVGTLPLNLAMLAVADAALGSRPLLSVGDHLHRRLVYLAAGVTAVAGVALALGTRVPTVLGMEVLSPLLVVGYLWSLSWPAGPPEGAGARGPLRTQVLLFALMAVVVAAAASVLPGAAARIADQTSLGRAFIGSTLLSLATTLPELVVAYSAARIGAGDLAIGNAFGSILFNVAFLGIEDIALYRGPLLADADLSLLVPAGGALVMMAVVAVALTHPPHSKRLLSWPSVLLVLLYTAIVAGLLLID